MQAEQPRTHPDRDEHVWRQRVGHAFSRSAASYMDRAQAQHAMGRMLWQRLPVQAAKVLDLGCGPGHWTARLSRHFGVQAIGLDLALGMLGEARRRYGAQGRWLCGDAASLPLASQSIDLVFSNLAIQWCRDLPGIFSELHRILAPGGCALINTLAPGTLSEVAHAWSHPHRPAAVERFASSRQVCLVARQAGFEVRMEQASERFHYPNLTAVMTSIKGVGAQVAHGGPALTRRDIDKARQRYETLRLPAGLPVTYQRLTLELHKPR
ncbi:methyltransferase domain-containing protein [Halomonas sp. McH1-25]|uniref:methyltransferase domain-containing protein n=1 Tax=unclassified Halomonas TaxID=2609666 RepID=UPI001EF4C4C4|nr:MULTISPECIES: methyltransferase domain-containing protein [unclassified Halomonas]MCG7599136.1 methyltransferase domain-containing protein [Halomonas sp. McH1-25]MCP1343604.1 methyltransferase domain-containing protein [Halomonas sp. FL8]MCP1361086.1 methyltransferase domain-containing protein [Halomonas sp. BBD45]